MGDLMRKFALYYPLMQPPMEWLETAVLYWPKVARIRPPDARLEPSPYRREASPISEFTDAFVVDVDPCDAAEDVGRRFVTVLDGQADRLSDSYSLSRRGRYSRRRRGSERAVARMYFRKMSPALAGVLHSLDMVSSYPEGEPLADWLILDPWLAQLYMCALAEEIGRRNALLPVTDSHRHYAAASGWTAEHLATVLLDPEAYVPPPPSAAEAIGLLAVQTVVPAGGGEVSVDRYLKIRERYGADFQAFRDEVERAAEELGEQFAEIRDPAVLEAYLRHEVEARFAGPARDLRRALRGLGVETVTSTLTAKFEVPALLSVTAAGVLAHQPLIAGGSAVAAGVLSVHGTAKRRRAELMKPSAATYLHSLETVLGRPDGDSSLPIRTVKRVIGSLRQISSGPLGRGEHSDRTGWPAE